MAAPAITRLARVGVKYHVTGIHTGIPFDLQETIRITKKVIVSVKYEPRRVEARFVQSLNLPDRRIRGWGDAISPTIIRVIFAKLDAIIDKLVSNYMRWFGRLRYNRPATYQRRIMGIALLVDTVDRVKNSPEK